MAFVDFSNPPVFAAATPYAPAEIEAPEAEGLSALEWQVVAIARRDSLSTLSEPSRLAVALGAVFGSRFDNPRLADPRLEALRRMSVLSWHRGYAVAPGELEAFHAAGFTVAQYETLLASISVARTRREPRA